MERSTKLVLSLVSVPLAIGIAALIGHAMGMPGLVSMRPEFRAMSTLTAACVILLALGLSAGSLGRARLGAAASGLAGALALAVLASHGLHGEDLVSAWWSRHVLFLPGGEGRTSRSTAIAICFLALTLLAPQRARLVDFSAALSLLLSTFALLGYAYGVSDLYAIAIFNNMALNTAAALFLLSIAALCVRPAIGWSAIVTSETTIGGATRRQLAFCVIPAVIGWIVVQAVDAHRLGVGAAMALLVAGSIVPIALLILRDGKRLLDRDHERQSRDQRLASAAAEAQAQLADQALRLQREGAERAKVEEAMYRAQRLEAVGQLTGGIAHDFNNLLMVLGGNVQLLKRRIPADDPLRRYVDNLGVAVTKGSKVTQQLLAFSRSQRLDIKATPVETVVVRARQLLGSSLGPSVAVDIRLQADSAWALCDADQLELALLNLAVNSRDAMPDGGRLTITCTVSRMAQPPRTGEPCVLVRVADNGAGMAADVAAHAAEPFFTTKERGKGTGLGLAQVHGFVAQCKGELGIVSVPGQGTVVEMRFPLVAPPVTDIAPAPASTGPGTGRPLAVTQLRVIVIDDDDGVRDVIVQALTEAGYDVVSAIDGRSGLAEMAAFRPAAAVIDFIMPGMHGADVARAAQARYPDLPIIFVSGYSDTAALEGVSGATVLRKPFEIATLTRMVERAVTEGDT